MDEDFGGRKWDCKVLSLNEAKELKQTAKEQKKVEKTAREQQEFLNALDNLGHVPTKTELRNYLGWDSTKFPRVSDQLKLGKLIEEIEIETDIGNGAKRQAIGVRRLLQN